MARSQEREVAVTMRKTVAVVAVLGLTAGAFAAFTSVGSSSETNTLQILNYIYSTTFTTGGNWGDTYYTDGTIQVTRVEDHGAGGAADVGSALHLTTIPPAAGAYDQLWSDGVVTNFSARARFAGFNQEFGWYDQHSGALTSGNFNAIGGPVSSGLQNTLLSAAIDFTGKNWRWGRRSNLVTDNYYQSSRTSENWDVRDHMITYYVTGAGATPQWLLFWDDQLDPNPVDLDYNDLVIQLGIIPAPAAALLGLMGLGTAGWFKRR